MNLSLENRLPDDYASILLQILTFDDNDEYMHIAILHTINKIIKEVNR
jgi:hypothetical protein